MRRVHLAVLALVVLLAPTGASAKAPLTAVRACGIGACAETRDAAVLAALRSAFVPDVASIGSSPRLAPYVELRGGADWPEQLGYFVPGTSVVQWGWPGAVRYWVRVEAGVLAELERVTATVELVPQPVLSRVIVNGRFVRNPRAYLMLFEPMSPRPRPRARGPIWIPITFLWRASNPWSGDDSTMLYDRDDRALLRSGTWYRVPPSLGRMITRAAFVRR